jgi:ACS family D-galactonate transporter-like MFS transporter
VVDCHGDARLRRSFIALFVLRMAVGALEAPAYPINSRVVTTWFPERERATAIGFYTSGQFVGLAFLTPVLAWLQHEFGWHMVFVTTGAVGILWARSGTRCIANRVTSKAPTRRNRPDPRRRRAGGHSSASKVKASFSWADLGIVLSKRKLWGIYLGQFCLNSTLWFFLTWFPTYLVKYRGMDFIKSGLLASLPFLAAFVGVLCSGFFSDLLIRRGCSVGLRASCRSLAAC